MSGGPLSLELINDMTSEEMSSIKSVGRRVIGNIDSPQIRKLQETYNYNRGKLGFVQKVLSFIPEPTAQAASAAMGVVDSVLADDGKKQSSIKKENTVKTDEISVADGLNIAKKADQKIVFGESHFIGNGDGFGMVNSSVTLNAADAVSAKRIGVDVLMKKLVVENRSDSSKPLKEFNTVCKSLGNNLFLVSSLLNNVREPKDYNEMMTPGKSFASFDRFVGNSLNPVQRMSNIKNAKPFGVEGMSLDERFCIGVSRHMKTGLSLEDAEKAVAKDFLRCNVSVDKVVRIFDKNSPNHVGKSSKYRIQGISDEMNSVSKTVRENVKPKVRRRVNVNDGPSIV